MLELMGGKEVTKDLSKEMGKRNSKAQHQERVRATPTNEELAGHLTVPEQNIIRVMLKSGTKKKGAKACFCNWHRDFPVAWAR